MTGRRVVVSRHAVDRARTRYRQPLLRPLDVRNDVLAAVAAGREGLRVPSGLALVASRRSRREGSRYAWTEALDRCYLVKRRRARGTGEEILVVVTALSNGRNPA